MNTEDKKLKIGFDMDGVLTSFYLGFRKLIKDIHGINIPEEHPSKWYWCREYLTRKQEDMVWRDVYKSETFWRDLPVCPKLSVEDGKRIKKLCKTDEVYFITNTVSNNSDDAYEQRQEWLLKHCGLERGSYKLILSDNKIEYINKIGLNLFVDDKSSFLVKASRSCPKTVVTRMNWEYNKDIAKYMVSVDSVAGYLDLVNKYRRIAGSLK